MEGCQWPTEFSGGLRMSGSRGPRAALRRQSLSRTRLFPSAITTMAVISRSKLSLFSFYHWPLSSQSKPQAPWWGKELPNRFVPKHCTFYIATSNGRGSQFLYMITDTCHCLPFLLQPPSWVKWCLVVLIGMSLMTGGDVEHFCMCPLAICISLEKYLLKSFACF